MHESEKWKWSRSVVNNPPANAGDKRDTVWSLGQEDPLEKGMATHSSSLAWRIPWTEEAGRLQSMGPQGVGHLAVYGILNMLLMLFSC